MCKTVAVRLEGGLGDHILGMRVLDFVRPRFPHHDIIAYCDAARGLEQPQVATLSPVVSRVVSLERSTPSRTVADMGPLEHVHPEDLALMKSADVFIDTYGAQLFASASILLNVPPFEIMAHRPTLVVPPDAQESARQLLARFDTASVFVGLNLAKYGPRRLQQQPVVERFLNALLQLPDVVVLHLFRSSFDFAHWPDAERQHRQEVAREEYRYFMALCERSARIVPCVDLPIATVAALLTCCRYFLGVDNGVKHLAWALGVPHTFLYPRKPEQMHAVRWMPDLNRLLLFDCRETTLMRHLAEATTALTGGHAD